jgi:hypothetical protein
MGGIAANIPLMGQAPQLNDPLAEYQKGLQIKSLIGQQAMQQQQMQAAQTEQQQRELALGQQQQDAADRDAFNKSFKDANGNWDEAIKNAPTNGMSGQGVLKYQLARTDQVSKMATMQKDLLANEAAKSDQYAKDAYQVQQTQDPDARASLWTSLRNGHIAAGTAKPGEIPEQVPDDQTLQGIISSHKASADMAKEAITLQQEKAKLPGDQAEATAKGYSTAAQTMGGAQDQLSWTARRNLAVSNNPQIASLIPEQYSPQAAEQVRQLGIAPKDLANQAPDKLELQDWLKKNPGKGPADFMAYKAKLIPQFNFNLANNAGQGKPAASVAQQFGMTPEAFDQTAEKYATTGQMPAVGRGPNGVALQRAIMNRAAELHGGESLAANSAEYKANAASLGKLQTNLDNVTAFENTAGKNLKMFTDLAQKAIDTGIPLLNTPIRMAAQGLGSEDQAALNAARQVAINEIAKVTSNPTLAGQLSDSARHEVEAFIPANATYGQAIRVANLLTQDMENRRQSTQEQVNDIQKRLGGKPQQIQQFNAPTGAPAAPKEDGHKLKSNGQVIAVSKGGQWVAP